MPNSSWYTQRLGTAEVLSVQDVIRGPYHGSRRRPAPGPSSAAKSEGISPGLTVRDSTGTLYFVKFDPPSNPEMATGAEAISTRLFWALGFNVPENYLVVAPTRQPAHRARHDARRRARPDAGDDRGRRRCAAAEGGAQRRRQLRVVASKGITGKDVGPFKYYGTRPDDPNDIHPHEHRRELRAMRVFGAWLNHDDSRAINTRDFLQDVGGRKILRHYLIDFGSTLGSGSTRAQGTRAGNEYIWEARPTFVSMVTLGFYVRPWLKVHYPDLPAVGRFEANFFRPERWKPEYPNPAFDNARPDDLFWGARGVMAFSDETIIEVSRTAAFTDPEATAYMAQTLITRRDKIGQLWLNVVLPVDDFDLDGRRRVHVPQHRRPSPRPPFPGRGYTIAWARFDNTTGTATTVGEPQVVTEPRATAPREALGGDFVQATLTGDHPTHPGWAIPTTVVFRRAGAAWSLVGVDR